MNKAVFLDKDGTLIPDIPFNADPSLITLSAYAGEALAKLSEEGYMLIVVSNQSGVAMGYFTIEELEFVSEKINQLLLPFKVQVTDFFYCPHFPGAGNPELSVSCTCRKPQPGLLLQASAKYDIDLQASWMIGDILNDCEAGKLAGCQTILIDNGNETEWLLSEMRQPDYSAANLLEAATIITTHQIGSEGYEKGRLSAL